MKYIRYIFSKPAYYLAKINRSFFYLFTILILIYSSLKGQRILFIIDIFFILGLLYKGGDLGQYILKRIIVAIPLLFIIIATNWLIVHLAPGSPVDYIISGLEYVPIEYIKALEEKFGLNQPLHIQFIKYMWNFIRGDFGYSYVLNISVAELIGQKIVNTLLLSMTAFMLSVFFGLGLGILCAIKEDTPLDSFLTSIAILFWSMPYFWIGILMILIFSLGFKIFPVGGIAIPGLKGWNLITSKIWHVILPATSLALGRIALYLRFTRRGLLEELNKNYIVTAKAKGCDNKRILFNHALGNAAIPLITIIGLRFRYFISGSILIETVFSWPGLGRLVYEGLIMRDYAVLTFLFLIFSILTIIGNLCADIIYAYVDPRIRYKGK